MKTIGQLIKEELIRLSINDELPQDLNELDANLFDKIAMGESKQFPNGFTSWMETHHEIVLYIARKMQENGEDNSEVFNRLDNFGIGGAYELVEEWTDEFELKNAGNLWDEDDYFDSLEEFCNLKNYGNGSKL